MATIQEIKQATRHNSPHFFDRDTMRFFGQTMRDFKVKTSPAGRVYIYAPGYDGRGGRFMGYTVREFADNDLKLVPKPSWKGFQSEQEVLDYIKEN